MTAEKFCFCFKLPTGCLLLGIITFLVSSIEIVFTFAYILPKRAEYFQSQHMNATSNVTHHANLLEFVVSHKSMVTVVVGFIAIICFLWMAISVMLIIGIVKKRVNFVMTYFLYGIVISIIYLLMGLLELINGFWIMSLLTIILTLIYIKCLASVYTAYDIMRQMRIDDLEQLIDDDSTIECSSN